MRHQFVLRQSNGLEYTCTSIHTELDEMYNMGEKKGKGKSTMTFLMILTVRQQRGATNASNIEGSPQLRWPSGDISCRQVQGSDYQVQAHRVISRCSVFLGAEI